MRVLIVEDEVKLASLIRRGMRAEGLAADVAIKGEDALWMAEATEYDAIVLDIMLPGIDGLEVCRRLRDAGVWSPILLLTARDAVSDRVAGLDGGADDYLTKPFSFAELLARLRALVRRGAGARPVELRVGDLRLDPATRRVHRGETEVSLSAKEFAILETFMRRPGEVLSRYALLEQAWDYDYENRSNVVDSYVRFLRRKIDKPFGTDSIETVRGAGYRLRENGGGRSGERLLAHVPIRVRVTLAFAGVMAIVLIAIGLFLYLRLEAQLDESIDNGLRSRATEVSALARDSDGSLSGSGADPLIELDESFAQILGAGGRPIDSSPQVGAAPALARPRSSGPLPSPPSSSSTRSAGSRARCACSPSR